MIGVFELLLNLNEVQYDKYLIGVLESTINKYEIKEQQ